MGNTAILTLPYPENTDPLANMALAVKALAEAVETKLTAAWTAYTPAVVNLTLGNGVKVSRYRMIGKTLQLRIYLQGGTTTSASGLIQIPLPAGVAGHASGAQTALVRHWNGAALGVGGAYLPAGDNKVWLYTSATGAAGITTFGNGHEIDLFAELELA